MSITSYMPPIGGGKLHAFNTFSSNQASNFSTTSTTFTLVTGASFEITTTKTCTIIIFVRTQLNKATAGYGYLGIFLNDTWIGEGMVGVSTSGWHSLGIIAYKTNVTAGTHTITLKAKSSDNNTFEIGNTTPTTTNQYISAVALALEE